MKKVYTVYAVWAGHDDGDDYSGYAYADKAMAEHHASRVWMGSVKEIDVYEQLPEWVRLSKAPAPVEAGGDPLPPKPSEYIHMIPAQLHLIPAHLRGDHYNGQPGGCPLCPTDLMPVEDEL